MALKSDDILLVQRGTQSYQMPASQLASADSEVAPSLQTVTDKGSTTTNKIDITDGDDTTIDGQTYKLNASFSGSGTALSFANILRGDSTRSSAIGNGNTSGDLLLFNTVSGTKKTFVRLANNGQFQIGEDLTNNSANIFFNTDGSGIFGGQLEANDRIDCYRPSANANTYVQRWHSDVGGTKTQQAVFLADGRAEFNGSVRVGDEPFAGANVGSKLSLGSCQATAAATNNDVWLGYVKGTSTETSRIGGDGSASFAGTVTVADGVNTSPGIACYSAGQVSIRRDEANKTALEILKDGNAVSNQVARIDNDGSASFSGVVKSESPAGTFSALNPGYLVVQQPGTSSTDLVFRARTSVGSETIEFFGDGHAVFTGEVISNTAFSFVNPDPGGMIDVIACWDSGNNTKTSKTFSVMSNGTTEIGGGSEITLNPDGRGYFTGKVSGTVTTITSSGDFDLNDSNFWTATGPGLNNPTASDAGQTGVIYCTGEVNSYGNRYSFPGGQPFTIPANSIVPYYVDQDNKIRLGFATEAFV